MSEALLTTPLAKNPDYADLCLFEALSDPVLFQKFVLPAPLSEVQSSEYQWDERIGREVWYFQYYFLLWPQFLGECGRAIGKTTVGMQGATAYDLMNYPNLQTGILGPSDQHAMRVFDEVVNLLVDHRYLRFWLSGDPRRQGLRTSKRQLRAKNGWSLHALIPGRQGIGFKGEHPQRVRGDEAQDIPELGWTFLVDMIRPWPSPKAVWQYFGVPDGNRTTQYANMCHNKSGSWARWKKRIPSFCSPLMSRGSWIHTLSESGCRWEELPDGRVVVLEYSNDGKRNILGQWGDPVSPCFPLRVYEAATLASGIPGYTVLTINPGIVDASGLSPEDVTLQLLMGGPHRDRYSIAPDRVFVAVDPGPAFCSVTIWGNWKGKKAIDHSAEWVMLERFEITEIMDTNQITRIIDRIADFWQAEWVGSDSTSQSVYVADWLMNEQLFGFQNRRRLTLRGKVKPEEQAQEIAECRGWKGQVIVPVDFAGNTPSVFLGVEDEQKNTDIFTTRVLQMMMNESHPRLLLPPQSQDLPFFSEVTSYRETLTAGGKRFEPAHPHMVSTMKVLGAMIHYADLLDVPTIWGGEIGYAGAIPHVGNVSP